MPQFPARLLPDPRDKMVLDKDARDFLTTAPVVTPTGDVSLEPYCVPMDQLSLEACAGNATAESEEILSSIAGYKATPVSRLFIYNLARNEDGDLNRDAGTYIHSCFDVLTRFGVCDEYLWPYDLTKVSTLPSMMALRQAAGHKISASYRIFDTANPQDRIAAVIAALRANHPVVFGTQVSSDFQDLVQGTAPQSPPTVNIVGGHAMVIVGYIGGNFLVKNSWGTGWANGGFCTFLPSYIMDPMTSDLWVPTLATNLASLKR